MPSEPEGGGHATWRWALLLVGSLHLLTTAGKWSLTDHIEYLYVAQRLLDGHGFALADPGIQRLEELPWLVATPQGPLRTRLLPGTPLTLVPLIALDRWLGLEDGARHGRLVHLQGHLFVLVGLACLGSALRAQGASQGATAAAVALTGLTWPVWMVARQIGSEPIMVALVCAFLAAASRTDRVRAGMRIAVCAALPWVSPLGSVISLALAAATLVDAFLDASAADGRIARLSWAPALGCALGVAGVALIWNRLYHGEWWLGGYSPYAARPYFGVVPPLEGLARHLRALTLEGAPLLLPAALGLRASGAPRRHGVTLPLFLTGTLLALFATFYQPEPARRFVVVWPAVGAIVGRTWDRLKLPAPAPQALLATAGLLGFYWLMHYEGRRYPGPAGLFYPNVLWVERLLSGAPLWQLLPAAALFVSGLLAGARTWQLLRRGAAA